MVHSPFAKITTKLINGHSVFRPRKWLNVNTFITLPSHLIDGMKTKRYSKTKRTLE